MPEPHRFDDEMLAVKSAIRTLALDFHEMEGWSFAPGSDGGSGGPVSSSGRALELPSELLSSLSVVFANFSNGDSFSGNAILPVKQRYVTGTQIATRALFGLLYVYGGHIAAEREIWVEARSSMDRILDEALRGFVLVAADSHANIDLQSVLSITGVALDGLSLLAAATGVGVVASVTIGAVGLGVKAIGSSFSGASEHSTSCVADAPVEQSESMGSYHEVIEFMNTAVSEFRDSIRREEEAIEKNIRENLDSISEYSNYYDLTGALFDDQNRSSAGGHAQITWLPSAAAEGTSCMRTASEFYITAGKILDDTDISAAAKRHYSIGTSANGPAQPMNELGSTIRALLLALGAELQSGADNIDGATDLFMEAENEYKGKLVTLERAVDLASVSQVGSDTVVVDPLADGTPEIPPLNVRSIMQS